jgi:hypothetical protein
MVTLVLTWGMQQESFLAWSIGASDPYPILLGKGGGITTIQAPRYHGMGAMPLDIKFWVVCLGP